MIVGVCGSLGMVGSAAIEGFEKRNLCVKRFDIRDNDTQFESLLESDVLFLCLPTLYSDEKQMYNKDALESVCGRLQEHGFKGVVVNKSTVEPGTTDRLAVQFGLQMVHNPEFLTARTAKQDFDEQNHIVIGQAKTVTQTNADRVQALFATTFPHASISICSAVESECVKIFVNNHYATKVQQFNEFFFACKAVGADYDHVKNMMLKNGWIHSMHTNVPGPDGQLSFGGMCFPKDTRAFLAWQKRTQNCPFHVTQGTVDGNIALRNDQ